MRSTRRRTVAAAGLLALSLGLAGCGGDSGGRDTTDGGSGTGSAKLSVVASTNVYGDIVRQVAGDTVRITSIISDPSQDPHSYEASTTTQLALSKADLVVENGGGYDDFVDTMLEGAKNTDVKVINAVDVSGKSASPGDELNEHVWYDFPTVSKVTDAIVSALGAADPAAASTFTANAATFKRKLGELEAQERAIEQAHQGDGVAITEPVPLYLLEASGLVNKTPAAFSEAIEEGKGVSPAVLSKTLALFDTGQVKLLAYNEQTSGPETEKVLAEARAKQVAVVPVTETLPAGKDYLGWMTANLAAISTALR